MIIKPVNNEEINFITKCSENKNFFNNEPYGACKETEETKEIERILKKCIPALIKFKCFTKSKDGVKIRITYDWCYGDNNSRLGYFEGAGYILINDLKN